jgi:ubiquinol-cytochrome c reductase cytochrome b subunit
LVKLWWNIPDKQKAGTKQLGTQPATPELTKLARIFSATYFLFFIILPFTSAREKTKPVPERVT